MAEVPLYTELLAERNSLLLRCLRSQILYVVYAASVAADVQFAEEESGSRPNGCERESATRTISLAFHGGEQRYPCSEVSFGSTSLGGGTPSGVRSGGKGWKALADDGSRSRTSTARVVHSSSPEKNRSIRTGVIR